MSTGADSVKTVLYALGANSAIAVAKFAAAAVTGSSAMLAEAIHSTADSANQLLLLLGLKRSIKPADDRHPLGYGREIYFWSFVVAVLLFSVGGIFSIYEGVHKLSDPQPVSSPMIAIVVLVFAIFAEGISLRACIIEVNKVRGQKSLWQWFRHSRQSELLVVMGEDIAAQAGLVLALLAICMTAVTGNPVYDAMGSIAIGVLLVIVAGLVGIEVRSLLVGESADPEIHDKMEQYVASRPEVDQLFNLITMQQGPGIMVAVKAQMVSVGTGNELVQAINQVESGMRSEFPDINWLFFEPDLND
ncbi:MAG: cation diffusion facilitator family transporter [Pseudomonadales bacterium]